MKHISQIIDEMQRNTALQRRLLDEALAYDAGHRYAILAQLDALIAQARRQAERSASTLKRCGDQLYVRDEHEWDQQVWLVLRTLRDAQRAPRPAPPLG